MAWTVETLNETVDAELAELPADMRARLVRISELIEQVGLPNVREPHVRHVREQIWEIRLKGKGFPVYKKEGEYGDLYVTYSIKIPVGLADKEKELFRELANMRSR